MPTPSPCYTIENCKFSSPLQWGLSVFWQQPITEDPWLAELAKRLEPGGIRMLRHNLVFVRQMQPIYQFGGYFGDGGRVWIAACRRGNIAFPRQAGLVASSVELARKVVRYKVNRFNKVIRKKANTASQNVE